MSKHTPKSLGCYLVYPESGIASTSGWRGKEYRFLEQHLDDDGYKYVRLVLNGKRKKWRVHRLMAELFLGPRPSDRHEIRHLDGNKSNNHVDNLAWGTRLENANDRERHGRTSRGATHKEAIKKGIELAKANARLIAAAPEMLETLKTCLEFVDSGGLGEGINAQAKATLEKYLSQAIAKAEGRGE